MLQKISILILAATVLFGAQPLEAAQKKSSKSKKSQTSALRNKPTSQKLKGAKKKKNAPTNNAFAQPPANSGSLNGSSASTPTPTPASTPTPTPASTPTPTPVSTPTPIPTMITVQGGTLPSNSEFAGQTVVTFEIGKYEVTLDEWQKVRAWAGANGYTDLAGVGAGSMLTHPVQNVSWNDCAKWMNAKSQKEGLIPVYYIAGNVYKSGWSGDTGPTVNRNANGYRMPSEKEWEWAAGGGALSRGYAYSGSNDFTIVGWFYDNATDASANMYNGRGTWPVGVKDPNELGIYDMSGNVLEWCEDAVNYPVFRRLRGGSFNILASSYRNRLGMTIYEGIFYTGFRLARNAP